MWYPAEAKGCELLFVTIRLQDFTDLLDSNLAIVHLIHVWVHVVKHTIRGCKVDRHSHVDVPAILQVVYKVRLFNDIELTELNCASHHRSSLFIDQLPTLIFILTRLALNLGATQLN